MVHRDQELGAAADAQGDLEVGVVGARARANAALGQRVGHRTAERASRQHVLAVERSAVDGRDVARKERRAARAEGTPTLRHRLEHRCLGRPEEALRPGQRTSFLVRQLRAVGQQHAALLDELHELARRLLRQHPRAQDGDGIIRLDARVARQPLVHEVHLAEGRTQQLECVEQPSAVVVHDLGEGEYERDPRLRPPRARQQRAGLRDAGEQAPQRLAQRRLPAREQESRVLGDPQMVGAVDKRCEGRLGRRQGLDGEVYERPEGLVEGGAERPVAAQRQATGREALLGRHLQHLAGPHPREHVAVRRTPAPTQEAVGPERQRQRHVRRRLGAQAPQHRIDVPPIGADERAERA